MSTTAHDHDAGRSSRFRLDVDDVARLLVPHGELDVATAPLLDGAAGTMQASRTDDVTVDLGRVTFIGAAGLNSLVAINRRQRFCGHRLRLRNPSANVVRVFWSGGAEALLA